ncbi:uncharacterized protein N7483_009239 [Penicillium malachiteum]|uniref:uncharacterized protein n=1 Tax=Penicillium malachiteum TaxID=1324776 RepID=UPI002548EA76|nr:uncharacterized protein N7483_009239 [Penicillium malachiteum]KAJ5721305.1 hypothetical protein N7483_009239 [Penicillium malachiteum]
MVPTDYRLPGHTTATQVRNYLPVPGPLSVKMFVRYLLAMAILGLTQAASENNSVVSLFIYGADQQSLVGSVIESRSEIATYSINCPPGTNSTDCGVSSGLLYTEGPTTVQWELQTPYDANVYGRVICSTGGTTTAVCTEVTPTNGSTAVTSETTALNSDQITLLAVTITASANTSSSNATVTAITTTTATNSSDMGTSTSASGDTVPINVPKEFFLGGLAVALIAIAL